MSFNINGETWEPKTALQHADLIIDKINELLQENNIKDKDGNTAQLKKNYGNALYLLALGDGSRLAENDEQLSKAIDSFNIELCDDQQIQNLLPIAAITRNPGSYSTLQLVAKASDDGDCVIPAGTKAPFNDVNFVTQTETVISAGSTQIIETQKCLFFSPHQFLLHTSPFDDTSSLSQAHRFSFLKNFDSLLSHLQHPVLFKSSS